MIVERHHPENSLFILGNERIALDLERAKKWFSDYSSFLWETEKILLGDDCPFTSLDNYIDHLYQKHIELSEEKFNKEYPADSFYNSQFFVDKRTFRDRALIAMAEHVRQIFKQLLILFPDETQEKYNQSVKKWQDKINILIRAGKYGSQEFLDLDSQFPTEDTSFDRVLSLIPHLQNHLTDIPRLVPFYEIAKKFDFRASFQVAVFNDSNPKQINKELDSNDFLVHTTDGLTKIQDSGYLGQFTDGRSVSASISRISMDREYAILLHADTLYKAGIPIVRVNEARDSEALREVLIWPTPLDLCLVIPTENFPDKKATNNTPNASDGTYYGEETIRKILRN